MFVARAVVVSAGGFNPSGMFKNGGQNSITSSIWVPITAWTADTGTYPGSTITSDGLNAQGTKTGATITANIPYTCPGSSLGAQARIKVNGTVVATGTATGLAASGTATATATQNLNNGDNVTVEIIFQAYTQTSNNVNAGTSTYLHIT